MNHLLEKLNSWIFGGWTGGYVLGLINGAIGMGMLMIIILLLEAVN